MAVRRARRIDQRWRRHQEPRDAGYELPVLDVAAHPDDVLRPTDQSRRHGTLNAFACLELRRFLRRDIHAHVGDADVVRLDSIVEVLWPRIARRHVEQVLDVDRRYDRLCTHVSLAVLSFDAGTAPILENEPRHLLVAEDLRSPFFEEGG